MELYQDQFSSEHDYRHQTETQKTLVIASTVRSGSHMLGHLLHQTDAFGFPLEYANRKNLDEWKARLNCKTLPEVLKALQARRTSSNGTFGIKIHYSHVQEFGGFKAMCDLLPNPHFVLLTREDVMAQAVSLAVAKQTGAWISEQGKPVSDPDFRFDDIEAGLRRVCLENASWRYSLAASGCKYMELNFSDVRSNTVNTVLRIADFMGIDVESPKIPTSPVTKRQSNELNKKWLARFQQEFNADNELLRFNQESIWHKLAKKLS